MALLFLVHELCLSVMEMERRGEAIAIAIASGIGNVRSGGIEIWEMLGLGLG
jgi:hypothetical protein